jgi:dTDP-3-amino-3,4,6-trideoxy-alpha-D-glucose transaminase
MIVPNDFTKQWQAIRSSVLEAVDRVGQSGQLILGKEVETFEKCLAGHLGIKHAIGVGNGLEALEICLRALGIGPDDKVITTPLSAFATTLAVMRIGAMPVFVDVDDLGQINLEQCRQLLRRDLSIRCLLPVHLYGFGVSLRKLAEIRDEFGLIVIEDCAQSIGCRVEGMNPGTVGRAAATSFYPTKNLGAMGDAGAVLTNDDEVAHRARAMRNYGQSSRYVHDQFGLNSRLDELQAAILHQAFLPRLPEWIARRQRIAAQYLEGITNPAIELLRPPPHVSAGWHLFPVLVDQNKREQFCDHLRNQGIVTGIHYPRLIPDQQALREYRRYETPVPLENARRFAASEVSLPIHPFLPDAEVQSIIKACNQWTA